jgi:hypothetical protein
VGELTFYFDRNFGKRFPSALFSLRAPVAIEWHNKQRFKDSMPDDEWLAIVGDRGWTVFSHDRKFHKETTETAAVLQHNVGCFYLPAANGSPWWKARAFFRSFERIVRLAEETPRPFIFDVRLNGRIVPVSFGQ